jgi:CDP-diacylglycerol--glycerol-3-phosphate 3-phosphatidyltransferase
LATIYDLKPRFQALLRPIAAWLAHHGISANAVTIASLVLSLAHGTWLMLMPGAPWPLLLLPVTLFLRMALNAIDGIMAKEHGQASASGAVLNELSDVIADAALYLPFALVVGLDARLIVLVVVVSIIAEMAGALGPALGVRRNYAGPFGKSDRAFGFGLLAVLIGGGLSLGLWSEIYMWIMLVLAMATVINRARLIAAEAKRPAP